MDLKGPPRAAGYFLANLQQAISKKTGKQSMTGPSKRLEETRKAFRHGDEAAEFIDACIVSPCPQAGLNHFADLAESGGIQSTHRVDITHVS